MLLKNKQIYILFNFNTGQPALKEKITNELIQYTNSPSNINEKDVVYLLVELRKLLVDHQNKQEEFPAIKFFADWCVHVSKDRIPTQVEKIIENEKSPKYLVEMKHLYNEINLFLKSNHISVDLFTPAVWKYFRLNLISVLTEQPIKKYGFTFRVTDDKDVISYDTTIS